MARGKRPKFDAVSAFLSPETQQSLSELTPLPLDSIRPDPGQPRRLLPPDLAQAVAAGEMAPGAALRAWQERVAEQGDDQDAARQVLLQNWQDLRRLADSISQHGLINPITVRPAEPADGVPPRVEHLIVTGERRYWAQQLLAVEGRSITEGEQQREADRIKALVAPAGISVRAHQMIENVQREDINAVEKASGLLALRYELSGVTHGSPTGADAGHEIDLVPWARVEEAVGLSKRHRIRLTNILSLSPGAQALAAEHNLTERALRPVVSRLGDYPGLQLQALTQLVAWQQAGEAGEGPDLPVSQLLEQLIDSLLRQQAAPDQTSDPVADHARRLVNQGRTLRKRVRSTTRYLDSLDKAELAGLSQTLTAKERERVVENLRQLQARVARVLAQLEKDGG